MASESLKNSAELLKLISNTRSITIREALIKNALKNPDFAEAVMEICLNLVQGNISLPVSSNSRINKHKKIIGELATKPRGKEKRKKLIIQSGGALPAIVPFLPFIATLVSEVIQNVG